MANIVLLVVVVGFVVKAPTGEQVFKTDVTGTTDTAEGLTGPLDQLSSADIAVNVARLTRLHEATSVANHADSVSAQLASTNIDTSVVAKPQVLSKALPSRHDIKKYVTKSGDTISSIARKFDISSDSVKWSNDLVSNDIAAGLTLYLPPAGQNGIVYVVKRGDTPAKLAQKYNTSKELIIAFNDAELTGLKPDMRILIPDGTVPATDFGATYNYSGFAFGTSPMYGYNGYDYGWCTWWAAKRRADIGRPVPGNLGDAYSWVSRARLAGLSVSSSPSTGSVIWSNTYYPGHVGFVEKVLADGSIWVTDMNSRGQVSMTDKTPAGGWNQVSWRHVSPDQFGNFRFIN